MKIGLLHYTSHPVIGGVERIVASHAALFRAHGHEVTVYAGEGAETTLPALRRAEGASAEELADLLRPRLGEQEIVFLHNVCTMPFHPALTQSLWHLAEELPAVRMVAWVHDLAAANPDYPVAPDDRFLRAASPHLEYVAVSPLRQRQVLEYLRPPVCRVVPNGIDPLAQWGVPEELRAIAGEERDLVLLHPARLLRRKNVETSLRVLACLRAAGRDASLLVTGPADPHHPPSAAYAAELRTLRAKLELTAHAHFLAERGPLSEEAVASLYRLADAVLLPSHTEGFGLPVLEAAMHRVPIFAPDAEPLRSLLGAGPEFYPPGDLPAAIASRIMHHADLSPAIQTRREALRNYAWPLVYRNFLAPLLSRPEAPLTP